MKLTAVVAIDENRAIGFENKLPWNMPADLQHFKKITLGKPILMGRKTYESIGRPLPKRRNVIISRDPNFTIEGCEVYVSIDAALTALNDCPEVMLIGGAQLFSQLLSKLTHLELTIIHHKFKGDTYFPEIDFRQWYEVACETYQADEQNPYAYTFLSYAKI
ncbi:MAG: dihydrofolate reductase [Gammaproteobacteria bacterium]|nr:dihydrofolate reductase [Gammaproteobacteria bacterium]